MEMFALQELSKWVLTQPAWQTDATRRILDKGTLEADDFDDLTALALLAVGVPDEAGRVVTPIDPARLPARPAAGSKVALRALRNPQNVNALAPTGCVEFETDGLTIVYGTNGSGKSGYFRILKAVCRARDQEIILSNVFATKSVLRQPSVTVDWSVNDEDRTEQWEMGKPCDAELAGIAVMDSRCARLFVDDELSVNIMPAGVDILRELARACDEVRARLDVLTRSSTFDRSSLAPLKGETAVGRFIDALSEKSDFAAVERMAELGDAENARLAQLRRQLSDEPEKRAVVLRRLSLRMKALVLELGHTHTALSDAAFGQLRDAYSTYKAAGDASRLAADELSEGGTALRGTGSDPWRELVMSAVNFAQEGPYPAEPFPPRTGALRCVLCQQPLDGDAKARLARFISFLEQDTQKRAVRQRRVAGDLYLAIKALNTGTLPTDKHIVEEVRERSPQLAETLLIFFAALDERRMRIVTMFEAKALEELTALPASPAEVLQELANTVDAELVELEKLLKSADRQLLRRELAELDARVKLAEFLPFVKRAIGAAVHVKKLSDCAKSTGTTAITRRSGELTESAIAKGLNEALTNELKLLNISTMKLGISLRGHKGGGLQQLKLDVANPLGKTKLSQILSEGEQRAIAIAAFLAEASLAPGTSGVVFDDPVSSLDVYRRELIATRLATEAKTRQVIVFTHDLAFAWYLAEAAEMVGAPCRTDRVYSVGAEKGVAARGLPFEAGKLAARINSLLTLAQQAKKVLEDDRDPERYELIVRDGYRKLRDCWERLIEEALFGDAIRRFRNSVHTKLLKRACVEHQDFQEVWEGMSRCSNFTHDAPLEAPPALPTPSDFVADVGSIERSFDRIRKRATEIERERVLLVPQAK
jgi:energy-coupling factor transporter ATP-binding protein EcfA2